MFVDSLSVQENRRSEIEVVEDDAPVKRLVPILQAALEVLTVDNLIWIWSGMSDLQPFLVEKKP